MKKLHVIFFAASFTLGFTNCRKGCTDPLALNYDERAKKENNTCEYIIDEGGLTVPSEYNFVDENGNSTVDFSGQAQRLDMLSEMVVYIKTANTQGVSVSASQLKDMYANNGYTWTDANSLGMTGSTKQLKNKTAFATVNGSPDTGVQLIFENYMDSMEVLSNSSMTGSPGVDGAWPNDGTSGPYLMDGQGLEYGQLIEKGLMSAIFASQITIHYLGTVNDDDNTSLVSGENYTEMQHHWDEAYGYFTSSIDFPNSGTDRFWGKYAFGREPIIQSGSKISEAFRRGRAAIDAEDYAERDLQITIIRNEMEKLQAGTVIHYLNSAKANITLNTTRNHKLSEAQAFLDGMRYGYNAVNSVGMTGSEIDVALNYIGTDFNNVTILGLNTAIDYIASKTDLTAVKDNL